LPVECTVNQARRYLTANRLFFGVARWERDKLKAGDRTYEIHVVTDGSLAKDRLGVYLGWFDRCFASQLNSRGAPPSRGTGADGSTGRAGGETGACDGAGR